MRTVRRRERPQRYLLHGTDGYPEPRHIQREIELRHPHQSLNHRWAVMFGTRFGAKARALVRGVTRGRAKVVVIDELWELEDFVLEADEVIIFWSGAGDAAMRALFNAVFDTRANMTVCFPDGRREKHVHGRFDGVEIAPGPRWTHDRSEGTGWHAPSGDVVAAHDAELSASTSRSHRRASRT